MKRAIHARREKAALRDRTFVQIDDIEHIIVTSAERDAVAIERHDVGNLIVRAGNALIDIARRIE